MLHLENKITYSNDINITLAVLESCE